MAGGAVAEPVDQIGAAIPLRALLRIGLKFPLAQEQRVPAGHQRPQVKREAHLIGRIALAHRRLRHQISVQRLHVAVGHFTECGVRKCRIQMAAVAGDALAHRPIERGKRPVADAGCHVRGNVGAVERAERRRHRQPAGVGRPFRCGMANRAVSGGGQLAAALQRGGRPGAGAGRRHRRDLRPPRQGAARDAQHRAEQPRRSAEPPFAALLFLGRCGLPLGVRPVQRLSQLIRGDRQLAKTNAGGVEHRVGDGRRAGHRRRLPGAQRRIVRARHHHHVHLRHLRKGQDRVSPHSLAETVDSSKVTRSFNTRLVDCNTLP